MVSNKQKEIHNNIQNLTSANIKSNTPPKINNQQQEVIDELDLAIKQLDEAIKELEKEMAELDTQGDKSEKIDK